MEYIAVNFKIDPNSDDNFDILSAYLDDLGFEGITDAGEVKIGYIPANRFRAPDMESLTGDMVKLSVQLTYVIEAIAERNWNQLWESNFDPVIIDNRCAIRAPFHSEFKEVKYCITIEPKMSFGTGHHQTTRLMLEKILELNVSHKNILDMGCGTGVLGILSGMMGAKHITAIDIDEWAYLNTLENFERNKINNVFALQGGVEVIPVEQFDVILANINRNIILDQLPKYAKHLKSDGTLLISGILLQDEEVVVKLAVSLGLKLNAKKSIKDWLMLEMKF